MNLWSNSVDTSTIAGTNQSYRFSFQNSSTGTFNFTGSFIAVTPTGTYMPSTAFQTRVKGQANVSGNISGAHIGVDAVSININGAMTSNQEARIVSRSGDITISDQSNIASRNIVISSARDITISGTIRATQNLASQRLSIVGRNINLTPTSVLLSKGIIFLNGSSVTRNGTITERYTGSM